MWGISENYCYEEEKEEDLDIYCKVCDIVIYNHDKNHLFCKYLTNDDDWICDYCFCWICKKKETAAAVPDFMERNCILKFYNNKTWCDDCLSNWKKEK